MKKKGSTRTAAKLLCLLMSVMMSVFAFSGIAMAEGPKTVSDIDGLKEAISAVGDGTETTIQLSGEISGKVETELTIENGSVILDLNGCTLNFTEAGKLTVQNGGKLVIKDGATDGKIAMTGETKNSILKVNKGGELVVESGTIEGEATVAKGISVLQNGDTPSKCTIKGGTITGVKYGIFVQGNGTDSNPELSVEGGTIKGSAFGITGNGKAGYGETKITITGGTIEGGFDGAGMYLPQSGTVAISGEAKISGGCGIVQRAGTLTVNGGTVTATATEPLDIGDAKDTAGDVKVNPGAIVIDAKSGGYANEGGTIVEIKDGTIHGTNYGVSVVGDHAQLTVSGGKVEAEENDEGYGQAISVTDSGHCDITGGEVTGEYGVVVKSGANLTVSGDAKIHGNDIGISGNGKAENGGTTVNINGGEIEGDNAGMYLPQTGSANVTDGTIKGGCGIVQRAGRLTVTGGTVEATADGPVQVGDRTEKVKPSAVVVDSKAGYPESSAVDAQIEGGSFVATAEVDVLTDTSGNNDDIEVKGGHFSGKTDGVKGFVKDPDTAVLQETKDDATECHIGNKAAEEALQDATADESFTLESGKLNATDIPDGTKLTVDSNATATVNGVKIENNGTEQSICGHEKYTALPLLPPDCTHTGLDYRTCDKCGYTWYEVLPANGHTAPDETTVEKEPTCLTEGVQSYRCTVCNAKVVGDPIPALGHDFAEEPDVTNGVDKPNCVQGTYKKWICTRDNCDGYDAGCDPKLNNDATGEEEVEVEGSEPVKKAIKVKSEPSLGGHQWGEPDTTPAKCGVAGKKVYTCTRENCPGYNADWKDNGDAQDQTDDGTHRATKTEEIPALEHEADKTAAEWHHNEDTHSDGSAGCTDGPENSHWQICKYCGEKINEALHGSTSAVGAQPATCIKEGSTGTGTCDTCMAAIAAQTIPRLGSEDGHSGHEFVTENPTVENYGITWIWDGDDKEAITDDNRKQHYEDFGPKCSKDADDKNVFKVFICQNEGCKGENTTEKEQDYGDDAQYLNDADGKYEGKDENLKDRATMKAETADTPVHQYPSDDEDLKNAAIQAWEESLKSAKDLFTSWQNEEDNFKKEDKALFVKPTKKTAKCTEPQPIEVKCKICEKATTTIYTSILGDQIKGVKQHAYPAEGHGTIQTPPTCKTNGVMVYECPDCHKLQHKSDQSSQIKEDVIEASKEYHVFENPEATMDDLTHAATCLTPGCIARKCTVCGALELSSLDTLPGQDAKGHTFEAVTVVNGEESKTLDVKADCINNGYIVLKCTNPECPGIVTEEELEKIYNKDEIGNLYDTDDLNKGAVNAEEAEQLLKDAENLPEDAKDIDLPDKTEDGKTIAYKVILSGDKDEKEGELTCTGHDYESMHDGHSYATCMMNAMSDSQKCSKCNDIIPSEDLYQKMYDQYYASMGETLFNSMFGNLKATGHSWAQKTEAFTPYIVHTKATCTLPEGDIYYCTNPDCKGHMTIDEYVEALNKQAAHKDSPVTKEDVQIQTDYAKLNNDAQESRSFQPDPEEDAVDKAVKVVKSGSEALGHDFINEEGKGVLTKDNTDLPEGKIHQHKGHCLRDTGCEFYTEKEYTAAYSKEEIIAEAEKKGGIFKAANNVEKANCVHGTITHYTCTQCNADISIDDEKKVESNHDPKYTPVTDGSVQDIEHAHTVTCLNGCGTEFDPEDCTETAEEVGTEDPNCSRGTVHHMSCTKCGNTWDTTDKDIDATAHVKGWHVMQPATCSAAGLGRWECATEAGEVDPATGYDTGKTVLIQYVVIPAGHVYNDGKCLDYNGTPHGAAEILTTTDEKAAEKEAIKDTEGGSVTYTCTRCKTETYTETIAPTAHVWGKSEVTQEGNCGTAKITVYTCTNPSCSGAFGAPGNEDALLNGADGINEDGIATKTVVEEPTGEHSFGDQVEAKNPDCQNDGNVAYYQCTVCHKYFDSNTDDAKELTDDTQIIKGGHQYEKVAAKAADCGTGEDGVIEHYKCTKCNLLFDVETAKADPYAAAELAKDETDFTVEAKHSLQLVEKKEPDCKTGTSGYNEHYECENCGKWFKDDQGEQPTNEGDESIKPEHDWEDVPPELMFSDSRYAQTCAHGQYSKRCHVCEEPDPSSLLPGFNDTPNPNKHSYNTSSGNFMPVLDSKAENYTPATCEKDGYWTFECSNPGCADMNPGTTTVDSTEEGPIDYKHTLIVTDKDSHLNAKHSFKDGECQVCGTPLPTEVDAPTAQLQEDKTMLIDANFGDIKSQLDESYEICQYGIYFAIKNDASNEETVKTEVINAVTEVEDKASITDLAKQAFLNIKPEEMEKGTILENTVHIVSGESAYDGAKHTLKVKEESHAKSVYARGYMVLKNKNDGTYSFIYTKVLRTSYNELAGE